MISIQNSLISLCCVDMYKVQKRGLQRTNRSMSYKVGGVASLKKPKKPVPNLKFAVAFGFFFGFFRFFVVLFRFFFGLSFDKKFQPFKNHVNNEVLAGQELPNNTLNAYKALQMSHKSYYNKLEPLNKNVLNQSKLAQMEKPKKPNKTSPKLQICGSLRFFLSCNPPPPPPPPSINDKNWKIDLLRRR